MRLRATAAVLSLAALSSSSSSRGGEPDRPRDFATVVGGAPVATAVGAAQLAIVAPREAQLSTEHTAGALSTTASVTVGRRLVLTGGAVVSETGAATDAGAPYGAVAGARVVLLRAARHGVDLTAGTVYRALGHEGRPELAFVVAAGRRFGRLTLAANALVAQELVEAQRHGEVRGAVLVDVGRGAAVGLDGRVAFDLDCGRDDGPVGPEDVLLDATVGPALSLRLGRAALFAKSGAHLRTTPQASTTGLFATAGLGGAF